MGANAGKRSGKPWADHIRCNIRPNPDGVYKTRT